jgi:hypothetical protein
MMDARHGTGEDSDYFTKGDLQEFKNRGRLQTCKYCPYAEIMKIYSYKGNIFHLIGPIYYINVISVMC